MAFQNNALHVPQPLVDYCVAYDPSEDSHIRNLFFPRKDIAHEVDLIHTVDTAEILRLYDLDVTGDSEVGEVEWKPGSDLTVRVQPMASKARITPALKAGADPAFQYEMRATKQAMISLGQRMEYLAVKQTMRSTSVLTQYQTFNADTRWDAFGSPDSSPIDDLQAAVATIRIKCGAKAGKSTIRIAMHDYTWMTLKQHQGVLDRIKYQGLGAILTKELLAKMLDLRSADDIIITNARYTNSEKGATAAYKAFIGSDVIVALVDDTDDLNAQALGREFVFDGLGDGNNAFLVRKWIEEGRGMHLHVPFVGVSCAVKYQATNAANAAYLLQGVIDATDTNRYPADMLD